MKTEVYRNLHDIQVGHLDENAAAIGQTVAEIRDLETRLAIANKRNDALRAERAKQIGQVKHLRMMVREAEAAEIAAQHAAEDEALA